MPVLSSTIVALTLTDGKVHSFIHIKHTIHYNAKLFVVK